MQVHCMNNPECWGLLWHLLGVWDENWRNELCWFYKTVMEGTDSDELEEFHSSVEGFLFYRIH